MSTDGISQKLIFLAGALNMVATGPARVLKLQDKIGQLAPGKAAGLLFLSDELMLRKVFVQGVQHLSSNN